MSGCGKEGESIVGRCGKRKKAQNFFVDGLWKNIAKKKRIEYNRPVYRIALYLYKRTVAGGKKIEYGK